MLPTYLIHPRPARDGYSLTGPGLAFPLWMTDDMQAIRHAEHLLRGQTGRIVVQRWDGSTEIYWHHTSEGRGPDSMTGLR